MINMILHKHSMRQLMLMISLIFMASVNCQLSIYGPEELKDKFDDGAIEAKFANFGFIPYGHSLVSKQILISQY